MTRKRLLRLTYIGTDKEPYHVAEVSAAVARSLIARDTWAKLYMHGHQQTPLHILTYAAVARQTRSPYVKLSGADDGKEIIIDVVE